MGSSSSDVSMTSGTEKLAERHVPHITDIHAGPHESGTPGIQPDPWPHQPRCRQGAGVEEDGYGEVAMLTDNRRGKGDERDEGEQ